MSGKKRLFEQMQEYVNILHVVLFRAIIFDEPTLNTASGKRIAACAANLMVGQPSPDHDATEQREARKLAAEILRRNPDIRLASVQCLRTLATVRGAETAFLDNLNLIDWISQFGDLPKDAPSPDSMHELAYRLGTLYGVLESN